MVLELLRWLQGQLGGRSLVSISTYCDGGHIRPTMGGRRNRIIIADESLGVVARQARTHSPKKRGQTVHILQL